MLPRVIAVCGAKRSGKDTIASIIANEYGYEHVKISQKLKDTCKILFNFTDDQMELDTKEFVDPVWGVSPRQCMQFIGTEVMQYKLQELLPNQGRSFWIQSLIRSFNDGKKYVISDLRFRHEYDEIKKLGGMVIKVNRIYLPPNIPPLEDQHVSEQEFKALKADYEVKNDTLDSTTTQIRSFFAHLQGSCS